MTHFEYSEKLETLKYLIKRKQAGRPRQLADKLNVSEHTILRMIQQLKDHGYPILFNRFRNAYEIEDSFKF